MIVIVHEVPAEAEARHGERRYDDEEGGEPEVPVVVDPVVHGKVIEVVGHDAVHHQVRHVGDDGDEGAEKVEPAVAQRFRQGVHLVPAAAGRAA
jgi:hypothetical protein